MKKIVLVTCFLFCISAFSQENPAPPVQAAPPPQKAAPQASAKGGSSFVPKPGVEITEIGADEASTPSDEPDVKTEKIKIPSGRDKVNAEVFYPESGGNWPIVILLHGSHPKRTDAYYDVMAIDLAMHGYLVIFPHYFERGRKGRGARSDWMRTIGDAMDYAQNMPNVDKARIALVGYSLGSFLALGYAPTDNRVSCVVAFYGGLSGCYDDAAAEHMPPTLLIHGMKDRTVPARRSLEAFKTLRESQMPVSVLIYPDVGHGFTLHRRGEWDDAVSEDSWNRTLVFLNYNLNFPAWTPEMPQPSLETPADGSQEQAEGVFERKKLNTPYLDNAFDAGEKLYIDPTGDEYAQILKQSQTSSRRRSSHKKSTTTQNGH